MTHLKQIFVNYKFRENYICFGSGKLATASSFTPETVVLRWGSSVCKHDRTSEVIRYILLHKIMFWPLQIASECYVLILVQMHDKPQRNKLGGEWGTTRTNGTNGMRPLVDQPSIHVPWPPGFLLPRHRMLLHPIDSKIVSMGRGASGDWFVVFLV